MNNKFSRIKTCLEDFSTELLMLIFDYLTSVEILISFHNLNKRFRLIACSYLKTSYRLTTFHLASTNYITYKRFCQDILPYFKTKITSFQIGSSCHYGQIDCFNQYQLLRLDTLTIHLTDTLNVINILENFLNYNRLQWFDKLNIILDEECIGWNERIPFCAKNIPVRELSITGCVPYVFAQNSMTVSYSITHLKIHLKYDHDVFYLLHCLPNLIEFNVKVSDRSQDLSNCLTIVEPLVNLKRFQYEGLMAGQYLRDLIMIINTHIEHIIICTKDYQRSLSTFELFAINFLQKLNDLKSFDFYICMFIGYNYDNFTSYISTMKYLLSRHLCTNIAYILSNYVGQIFSLPYAFNHIEIFDDQFFHQIQYVKDANKQEKMIHYWNNIQHLQLHTHIYDFQLLKSIKEHFSKLRSIDYRVQNYNFVPEKSQLYHYKIDLNKIKKLRIYDVVTYGCCAPEPLFLLTSNLVELDIEHFNLMQIISGASRHTKERLVSGFEKLRRVTVRQFDERLTEYFFSYLSHIQIFSLIFRTYEMQVYRTKPSFLDDLLHSMTKIISLKFEHIKRPRDYYAYVDMQKHVEDKLRAYYSKDTFWCKWYDDHTQKHNHYATFLCST